MEKFRAILSTLPALSLFALVCCGGSRCTALINGRQRSARQHTGSRSAFLRVAFLALLAASLGACGVARPNYSDPLANLVDANSRAFVADAPVKKAEPFGFILSDNVERFVDYINRNNAELLSYGFLSNTEAVSEENPRFLADLVVSQLKSRYTDIELVSDLSEAQQKRKKSVAIVDIQVQLGGGSGSKTVVEIGLLFFDENFQPLSKISAQGTATIPWPADTFRFRDASEQASRELARKLDALITK